MVNYNMSGGVAVNMDNRRRTSIGVDERALTTLEKFVELCENGLEEEDEENEDDVSASGSTATYHGPGTTNTLSVESAVAKAGVGTVKKCPSTGDATKEKEKSRKEKIYSRLNSLSWNYRPKKSEAHKVKLSELFIDPSLVALKTTAENSSQNGAKSGSTGDVATKSGKKSEEIWVKRVNDPGRRSFRITTVRS
ncbi:hypothetical protein Ocin01_01191 [Orchesella cincta]|uniref:Uncharacterized protein n=1 Tax=Orchesella cincta TaxID=48709 RepID=A0A1D2NJP4_ORCCI|nr:hypothetical protein Ocin01_01191 [Orchesella cincta]